MDRLTQDGPRWGRANSVANSDLPGFRETLAALRELAGGESGGSRALCRGLLRGAWLGLEGRRLLLFGFAELEGWRRAKAALR